MKAALVPAIERLLAAGQAVMLIRVTAVWGSTPRASGTRMAVTADGIEGTIGGGRLEWEAIGRARQMIEAEETTATMDMPLGPALGQCCGGRVTLDLAQVDESLLAEIADEEVAERADEPLVGIFGAGHVGKALAEALARLPVRLLWWDGREDALPEVAGAGVILSRSDPLAAVGTLESGSAVVVLTHIHRLDYEIAEAALARADLVYVGMIGSRTKRARFEKWLRARNGEIDLSKFVCPIGDAGVSDKRPEVIAALTAAEIIKCLANAAVARHDAGKANKNKKVEAGR